MPISLAPVHWLVTVVPPRAPLGSWPPPCHVDHSGVGLGSADREPITSPPWGSVSPALREQWPPLVGCLGPMRARCGLQEDSLPHPDAPLAPILRALAAPPGPYGDPGVRRSGTWVDEPPRTPLPARATSARTSREQAQPGLSHRGTHPRPPAPPAGSNLLGMGRWSSLAAPERPSPAVHPHSDGSARTAASGPLPCWNEPSALEFVEKSGVFRLLFFLARPYHKLVGKPEG